MEYRIVIEEHAGQMIVHTYIEGSLSTEQRDRIGVEAIQKLSDNNITKAIWDVRKAILEYSLTEVHRSILHAKQAFHSRENNYLAIIYKNNKMEFEHAKIATYNRRIPNIDFFQHIEEGVNWLAHRR